MRIRIPGNAAPEIQQSFRDVNDALQPLVTLAELDKRFKDQARKQAAADSSGSSNDFVGRVTVDGPMFVSGNVGIGKNPGAQLELSTDSAIKPTSNTWTIASDGRAKENVRDFTQGLEQIRALRPVIFDYNGRYGTPFRGEGVGVIAQEAVFVIPESIKVLESGGEKYLGFDSHRLTYLLVNAVKELSVRVAALEAK